MVSAWKAVVGYQTKNRKTNELSPSVKTKTELFSTYEEALKWVEYFLDNLFRVEVWRDIKFFEQDLDFFLQGIGAK